MKKIEIYLFKCNNCKRGWLYYLSVEKNCTLKVCVKAENGRKAKNKAITLANKGFPIGEIEILSINIDHKIWGINNFPELKKEISKVLVGDGS